MLYLSLDIWHGTCHATLITWYLTPVLTMLYLSLDIRHRYLPCYTYHLISDTATYHIWHRYLPCYTYHLIFDTGTCHAILITWYLTPVLTMLYLSLDIWYWHLTCYHLVLVHLIWYCDSWLDIITPDTCISLHNHDYHFYGDLIIILLPDIWYSWTPELLYSWTPGKWWLLILYSCWSP